MHTVKDIFKDNFTTNATVARPIDCFLTNGCKTASHEEQHYLWASVSKGTLWWFSSTTSLPREFLCICYPEQTSKHALSPYQLPFWPAHERESIVQFL